jgi:hypothetical protein
MLNGTGPLWATLGACAAATFVNPLGVRLWGYVLSELTHGTNRRYITEWRPLSLATDAWSTIVMDLIVLLLAAVAVAQWKAEDDTLRPRAVFWIVSCVPLIAMAYVSVRHVPLAAIWTAPVITLLAAPLHERWRDRAATRRVWFFLRGLALLPACLTFTVVYAEPLPVIRTGGKVLGATHPCGAVEFLRDRGFQGNIYNPLWWGGYLTWELYPRVRVSMDGRNISLYSDAMVVENLKFYTDAGGVADVDTPLRYRTDLLLVPANAPVLPRIAHDPRWRQIFSDRNSTIFERAEETRTAVIFREKLRLSEFSACTGVLE